MGKINPLSPSDPLSKLLKHSLLDREEELALIRLAQQGDRRALDSLVRHNLKFVMSVAWRYVGRGVDLEELFDEGAIGLQKAIIKFDTESGNRLSTYAIWWIRQAISRYVADKCRAIRVPVRLQQNLPDEAPDAEFGEIASRAALRRLSPVSLDQPVRLGDGHDAIECTLGDALKEDREHAPAPDTALERAELKATIAAALGQLKPREQDVIEKRFFSEKTLEEIAGDYGVTRERVRQIEAKALSKLRRHLRTKDIF